MKISVFGLGYVGCVGIGCLAELGHNLIGVDIDPKKVDLINSGKATVVEEGIDELIYNNYKKGNITATLSTEDAVLQTDVAIICVGTPSSENGHLDMSHIYNAAEAIGTVLRKKGSYFTIAIRSTVNPGTNKKLVEIIENASGKKNDKDFGIVSNPEFLREGSAVKDFFNPPYTILASNSTKSIKVMEELYKDINSEILITDLGEAELIKFVNNTFHALKVSFANEIGRICKKMGIDSRKVMELFVKDKILNISEAYLKPGFAYGGSCLPKDLKALGIIAHDNYISTPIISSIHNSNVRHIEFALDLILKKNSKNIGLYGLSFKSGTDDMRYSPSLEIAERLIGKGYNIKIYDNNVNISRITGKNKDFLFNKLPHINNILYNDLDEFLESLEILVIVHRDKTITKLIDSLNKVKIIDFTGIEKQGTNYEGICW